MSHSVIPTAILSALNFRVRSKMSTQSRPGCQMDSGLKITRERVRDITRRLSACQLTFVIVIITRGLAEMTCIGTAYGASPLTFLGLAGVGDLFLTCSSPNSRNYTVGYRLGAGESLDEITKTLGSVAEGVSTAKAVKKYIDELGVRAPIASSVSVSLIERGPLWHSGTLEQVYEVLYEGKDTRTAVRELMELPPSRELELPPTAGAPARELMQKLGLEGGDMWPLSIFK